MGAEVDAVGPAEGLAVGFEEGPEVSAAINENETPPLFVSNLSLPGAPTASVFEFTAMLCPNSESSFDESSMV